MAEAINHESPEAPSADGLGQVPREMAILIDRKVGFWEYRGTRAQLEAEGVIPPNMTWPAGKARHYWEDAAFSWCLRRVRPEGLKGPMKMWTSGDWWQLRSDARHPDFSARRINEKRRELDREIFLQSAAGQLACHAHWKRMEYARRDKAFRKFKMLVPALAALQRGRGPRASTAGDVR